MPRMAPELNRGARVVIRGYSGHTDSVLEGLTGTVRSVYGEKFYRVDLDEDPHDDTGLGVLCYAHELETI